MQRKWIVACLVIWNTTAAQLPPSTVAGVNACLGTGAAPNACFDRLSRQVFDGSILSVNATLRSPAVPGQLSINSTAQGGYGVLHARTSNTLNVSGQASSDAQAAFEDIVTISYAPLDGQPGLLYVSYRLSGSISSSGQNTSFAETKVFAGTSLEQQYSARYSSFTWGQFTLPQPIRFNYGAPFGLQFLLVTTNSFGANDEGRMGSGTATFADALVLSGLMPADQFGNPVRSAQFSSASGTQYGPNGAARDSGPAPVDPPPYISSVRPSSGPAGTSVTVSGSGFTPTAGIMGTPGGGGDYGGNTVQLGSDVMLKNLNSADGVTVQFEIPQSVPPGMYSVTIVNENGASNTVTLAITGN